MSLWWTYGFPQNSSGKCSTTFRFFLVNLLLYTPFATGVYNDVILFHYSDRVPLDGKVHMTRQLQQLQQFAHGSIAGNGPKKLRGIIINAGVVHYLRIVPSLHLRHDSPEIGLLQYKEIILPGQLLF